MKSSVRLSALAAAVFLLASCSAPTPPPAPAPPPPPPPPPVTPIVPPSPAAEPTPLPRHHYVRHCKKGFHWVAAHKTPSGERVRGQCVANQ